MAEETAEVDDVQAQRNGEEGMSMKSATGWMRLAAALAVWGGMAEASWADADIVDGVEWNYRVDEGFATVTGANPAEGALSIPDKLGGYDVASIGESAFERCNRLTGVTMGDGVTRIEKNAFFECHSLTSVTIGNGVTNIGRSAFDSCSGLTSVRIPESVTRIEAYAFLGCDGLTSVTIGNGVTYIGNQAFNYCSALTSVMISESVTSIERGAFSGCSGLKSFSVASGNPVYKSVSGLLLAKDGRTLVGGVNGDVVIPEGVTSIGGMAFQSCSGLTSVRIPESVTHIEGYAFQFCRSLTSVTIPNGVSSIGEWAFSECNGLTSVAIPDSVTNIGAMAFRGCRDLTAIVVEKGNAHYASDEGILFDRDMATLISCPGGKKGGYVIPDSVTNIGGACFFDCDGLTSVTIPNSVTSIRELAFYSCGALTSVTIPDGVTSIGVSAFDHCGALVSVTIPDSVRNIGGNAFRSCRNLTAIEVGKGNAHYASDGGVLFSKNMATLITFPGGKKGRYVIPDSVTHIGGLAFDGCIGLSELAIPDSVTSIGEEAFSGCNGLATLYVPASWEGTTMLASASVPSGCQIVYGVPPLLIWLVGTEGGGVDVGAEAAVHAETAYEVGAVAYTWGGDAPGTADGNVFLVDTGQPGGPYTLTCEALDGAGKTAESSVTFRILLRYPVAVSEDIQNGTVSADHNMAEEGETVILTAVPESGYRFVRFLVNGIAIVGNTFTMPGCGVVVSATFEEKLDYARLPFVGEDKPYSGPWGNNVVNGMTALSVNNYSDGSAKFDASGDYLQIKFVGRPGMLRYRIRGNGTDGTRPSTFLVQESADGSEWRVLARYVAGDNLFSGKMVDASHWLSSDSRYARFFYEKKDAGNVGIYDVYISEGVGGLSVEFDREEGFEVELGSAAEISVSAKNGRKPYAFIWEIDGIAADGGEEGTFIIPGTLEEGEHRVAATATDADGETARGEIGFTVVGLPPLYAVEIAEDIEHGEVTADKLEAKEGETVSLSVVVEEGYRLVAFWVNGVAIVGNTFPMPGTAVVVSARFEETNGEVFTKIWEIGDFEEGKYILAGTDAKGTHAAVAQLVGTVTVLAVETILPEDGAIESPKASLVWTVARHGDGWTIHNESLGYLGYTGKNNSATAEEEASDASTWSFSEVATGVFKVSNIGTPGRTLRYNPQSPRFACYASETMTNIELYKRQGGETGEDFAIGGLGISDGTLSFDAPEGKYTVEVSTNLLDKDSWTILEGAEVEGGRVVVPMDGAYGVLRVVW